MIKSVSNLRQGTALMVPLRVRLFSTSAMPDQSTPGPFVKNYDRLNAHYVTTFMNN